jgi:hypothetical protein
MDYGNCLSINPHKTESMLGEEEEAAVSKEDFLPVHQ